MSNSTVTETKLVITKKGKDSGEWCWLNMGGWAKGLKNSSTQRFANEASIQEGNMRASTDELNAAVLDGVFELKQVERIYSCM